MTPCPCAAWTPTSHPAKLSLPNIYLFSVQLEHAWNFFSSNYCSEYVVLGSSRDEHAPNNPPKVISKSSHDENHPGVIINKVEKKDVLRENPVQIIALRNSSHGTVKTGKFHGKTSYDFLTLALLEVRCIHLYFASENKNLKQPLR